MAETKEDLLREIARLVRRRYRGMGNGSKEYKPSLVDVDVSLGLNLDHHLAKPRLAQAIAKSAGLGRRWSRFCESKGDTITLRGLRLVRDSVLRLLPAPGSGAAPWAGRTTLSPGPVTRSRRRSAGRGPGPIVLQRFTKRLPPRFRPGAFARRGDPEQQRVRLEQAGRGHQTLVNDLAERFERNGGTCRLRWSSVDLYVTKPRQTPLLIEVKTIIRNPRGQVRYAVGQVLEYKHRLRSTHHGRVAVALAFDRKPPPWVIPYLKDGLGINAIWRTTGGFSADGAGAREIRKWLK